MQKATGTNSPHKCYCTYSNIRQNLRQKHSKWAEVGVHRSIEAERYFNFRLCIFHDYHELSHQDYLSNLIQIQGLHCQGSGFSWSDVWPEHRYEDSQVTAIIRKQALFSKQA